MHLAAATLFLLLVFAQTWPLARHIVTALPGRGAGDNVTFAWNIWWMRHVGANPFRFLQSEFLFFPFGASLILHTHTMLNAFVGATALQRVGIVEAQNVLVLASMTLNAVTSYALAFDTTRHRPASILAAVVFAGSPYFSAHVEGHFNLIAGWVIPLWLLLAKRSVKSGKIVDAVIAGIALAVVAYTDYYYVVFAMAVAICLWTVPRIRAAFERRVVEPETRPTAQLLAWLAAGSLLSLVMLIDVTGGTSLRVGPSVVSLRDTFNPKLALWVAVAIALLLRWRVTLRWRHPDEKGVRFDGRVLLIACAVFLLVASPLIVPGVRLAAGRDYVTPPRYFRSAPPGIDVAALIAGNPRHPVIGDYVRSLTETLHIDQIEGMAWLGIVPAVMAWIGVRRWPRESERRAWIWTFAIFLIWSLGPFLTICGWNTALVLPQTALRYLPIVSNARMPSRAMVVVYLALAMLSAMGLASLSARSRWTAWLSIVLTMADYASAPIPLYQSEVPGIYRVLRSRSDESAVLELPMGIRDGFGSHGSPDPGSPLFQTVHEHPVVGGFLARIPDRITRGYLDDPIFGPLLQLSSPVGRDVTLPSPRDLHDGLNQRGVRYVVVRRAEASASMTALVQEAFGSSLIASDAGRDLYELR